ncbi:MAG: hypothetical protein CVU63_19315 [Deltaproteobacteria bacterium HGW-Deltaproteobacteria-20]|nr:MAG: hypothetical protein CVU63_19315 [Deltaproteobacteria bacterium HGW-Deltaproteobacteria-20]
MPSRRESTRVVGIAKAGRQHIGAEHDATLHFHAKPLATGGGAERVHVFAASFARAEPDAVESREVAGRFGGRKDVVGCHGEVRVRQPDGLDATTSSFEPSQRITNASLHARVEAFGEVLDRNAHPKTVGPKPTTGFDGRSGRAARRGIPLVPPRDHVEQPSGALHIGREGSDLVQTGRERHQPEPRNPPMGRLDPHDGSEGRGLANGPARVTSEGGRDHSGRDGCRTSP